MLRELSIKNFAIIDDLSIRFSNGLTIFSGETGAGKSIIIDAVNLLLGGRAAPGLVRTGAETAELEAFFEINADSHAAHRMERHGYDAAEGLLVRRVISRKDRHRAYINGRMATIQILNEITENLASISGQRAHQGLLKGEQHLLMLDRFGGLQPLRARVRTCFHEMEPLIEKLNNLRGDRGRQEEQRELLEFQKKEILAAAIAPGEDEELERERERLNHAQALQQTVFSGLDALYDGRGAVVERLTAVQKDIESASGKDSTLLPVTESIAMATLQIEDVVETLRKYLADLKSDPHRLEVVEERLDTLNRLKRKYGNRLNAVRSHLASIDQTLSGMDNISSRIKEIESRLAERRTRLGGLVKSLSDKRRQAAGRLSGKVVSELASLKISPAEYQVVLRTEPANDNTDPYFTVAGETVTDTGIDHATFFIAPNVGEALKPLAGIASGGELSRVVLALKAILAETDSVETVVFDEVDAGIGGGVAEVVGKKLAVLSGYHQIICITHLAQIARFGDHHFRVSKKVSGGRTRTTIRPLNDQERVKEIARMLGGETITRTTLDHAREMLNS